MTRSTPTIALKLGLVIACGTVALCLAAPPPAVEPVEAQLVSNMSSIRPATPFWVGVRLVMKDGWHVNWINPGDAGLAPVVEWKLPDGFRADGIEWPFPRRHELPGVAIFGYDGEVVLLCRITPPRDLVSDARFQIGAAVSWLACREACVPGDARLTLSLSASASKTDEFDEKWRPLIERSLSDVPAPPGEWHFEAKTANDRIVIEARPPQGRNSLPSAASFFPIRQGIIDNNAPQVWSHEGPVFRLELLRDKMGGALPDSLEGVLVSGEGWEHGRKAVAIDIPLD
jgi:thiol:disulfide interchange protein DsbD